MLFKLIIDIFLTYSKIQCIQQKKKKNEHPKFQKIIHKHKYLLYKLQQLFIQLQIPFKKKINKYFLSIFFLLKNHIKSSMSTSFTNSNTN